MEQTQNLMVALNRRRVFQVLEVADPGDRASKVFDIFIISLIGLNIVAIVLESVASLRQAYGDWFRGFEWFSVAVFSVEYFMRLWSSVEHADARFRDPVRGRLRFARTPMAVIDLLAILPFYLSTLSAIDLRFLRVLRLLRVFKLTRYSSAMNLLLNVLRDEAQSFGAAFFILMVILIFAASGIYLFEQQAQPEVFGSIPAAMWWAIVTLTTVGYGDVTPITPWGKLFGACVTVVGIGMVALPAGILASAFSDQLRQRREEFEEIVEDVLEDGEVTAEEQARVERMREQLGIDAEEARKIFTRTAREEFRKTAGCPHCGKPLIID